MPKIHNDKYYTPTAVVKTVIKLIEKEIKLINDFDRIIEPSSGGGAFLKELPKKAIGYDIEPHYVNDNVIKGNYLEQTIPYARNTLVIGNPPFDDGSGSNNLHQKFIEASVNNSEWVVFVLPIDMYGKDNLPKAKLIKSYKLPEVKYSGVKLKTCVNIYKKRELELVKKNIKGVSIYKYARGSKNTYSDKEWMEVEADYRLVTFGTVRLIDMDEPMRCAEMKIKFDKPVNFKPILENYLKKVVKNSISKSGISKQDIINLIYDSYVELRSN